jgi:type II secretory pathway component PulJ
MTVKKARNAESGLTLAELAVAMTLATAVSLAGANLLGDYMATARTLRVQADGNTELMRLVSEITREFQISREARRACILSRVSGEPTDDNQKMSDFQCQTDGAVRTGGKIQTNGIGFDVRPNTIPKRAFINTCQPFKAEDLPSGRGGRHAPLISPSGLPWGGAETTCPEACPDDTRPVVRFIGEGGLVENRQIPARKSRGSLELWGALFCAAQFEDVRQIQQLSSRDFSAQYINVLTFVGRGRFDIKFPVVDGKPQSYVWMTGGTVLEFLDSQEMSIYRCRPGEPNC